MLGSAMSLGVRETDRKEKGREVRAGALLERRFSVTT